MAKNQQYAGFWIRLLAYILDIIVLFIPLGIVGFFLFYFSGLDILLNVVYLLGFTLIVYMTGTKGGTPGKLILGLRVVNKKGQFIGIPNALLREICKFISAAILFIGYLMIGWDKNKQGLHDKLAQTYVIKNKNSKKR